MNIKHGAVVSFSYSLSEQNGTHIENSDTGEPVLYLHGFRGLLDALQEGMEGLKAGDKVEVEVEAVRAYGTRKENSVHRIPLKHVVSGGANSGGKKNRRPGSLNPGDVILVNTPEGERDATVVKAGKFNVDIDTNHPLAGKDLVFSVEVVSVREASDEELQHGHAHGPGGHQHD